MNGQAGFSQLQYNLFFNNIANLLITTNDGDFEGNVGAVFADPQFVGPVGTGDASAQNFELEPTSPAINSARSEIGPNTSGNAIFPTVNLTLNGGVVTRDPHRSRHPDLPRTAGTTRLFGTSGASSTIIDPRRLSHCRDQASSASPTSGRPSSPARGSSSPNSVTGTYNYAPVAGQRDILGFIRAPQAGTPPGTGFGSNPFMDIGAYQYVNLHPPEVTGVTETPTQGATPVNFYTVGEIAGVKPDAVDDQHHVQRPDLAQHDQRQYGHARRPGEQPEPTPRPTINLSGKLSYNSATNTLVISLAASGLTLGTDAYQITLFGSGSPVLTNPQGVALDGENTVGGTSTGAQLALPSGNGYPGGNFFDSFIINTTPPAVLPGSLKMDSGQRYQHRRRQHHHVGTSPRSMARSASPIRDWCPWSARPPSSTSASKLVVNGVSTIFFEPSRGPPPIAQFIRPNAGTATSTTGGAFAVTVGVDGANTGLVTNTTALPDLTGTYNVGLDGKLSPLPGDDSGYYVARVRIIDQSGNQSNPHDPNAQVPFVVDNTAPTATFTSPTVRPGDDEPDQRRDPVHVSRPARTSI